MRILARALGTLVLAGSAVVLRPVNSYQAFMVKSTATAQTPALVVSGAVAAALGIRRGVPFAVAAGAIGVAVGTTYIRRATAAHNGLE